mmetsp:Transcript_3466/g.6940  ORF Transcript_3466/g.6940 Transcript_3466/m.6940 type:complete len:455 (+) Transcript_3466:89-1453(+)
MTPSLRLAVLVAFLSSVAWYGATTWLDAVPCRDDPPVALLATAAVLPCHMFSETYAQSRTRFQEAVQRLQSVYKNTSRTQTISLDSLIVGRDPGDTNLDYTIDIAVIPGQTEGLVFHSSGVHGVEGYAGSAIQLAFLEIMIQAYQQPDKVEMSSHPTVVLIHTVNPFGMANYRRFNENNVDLNRNGLQPNEWKSPYVTANGNRDNYNLFSPLFNPARPSTTWDATYGFFVQAAQELVTYGLPRLKEAMVRGQYHDPKGIFYGGQQGPEPSLSLLQEWVSQFLGTTSDNDTSHEYQAVTWIDVHTGLGPFGKDTLLMGSLSDTHTIKAAEHMEHYFPGGIHPSQSKSGQAVAQGYEQVKGSMKDFVQPLFAQGPARNVLALTQEFGTLSTVLVGRAMILENAAYQYLPKEEALQWAKQTTKPAFYPTSQKWRRNVLERGFQLLTQAMHRSRVLSE